MRPWTIAERVLATGGEPITAQTQVWNTALAWQDGGVPELKGIMLPQEEALDDAVGIVRGKHNKSRSGREQSQDAQLTHREKKRLAATHYRPNVIDHLQKTLEDGYMAMRSGPSPLKLDAATQRELVTYFAALPWIIRAAVQRTASRSRSGHGHARQDWRDQPIPDWHAQDTGECMTHNNSNSSRRSTRGLRLHSTPSACLHKRQHH